MHIDGSTLAGQISAKRPNVSKQHINARDSDMARLDTISWQIEQMARRIEAEEQATRVRDAIVNLLAWSAVFGAGFWTGFLIGSALLA